MADYHKTYETAEKEDTEWDAIHRKLGNFAPKPERKKAAPFEPKPEVIKDEKYIEENKDIDELEDLEDDFADDSFLEAYRKKRLEELKSNLNKSHFGSVIDITANEFIPQVTNAGQGIWVIVLLTDPSHMATNELNRCIEELAVDFPMTKFCRIPAQECIPGYPRYNLPTLLVYRDTNCIKNISGNKSFGNNKFTADQLAIMLNEYGPICK